MSAFVLIAVGGLGSLIAGILANKYGHTPITIVSLLINGACVLFVGHSYGENPVLLLDVCTLWGFTIVADSLQYSASIREISRRENIGIVLPI